MLAIPLRIGTLVLPGSTFIKRGVDTTATTAALKYVELDVLSLQGITYIEVNL